MRKGLVAESAVRGGLAAQAEARRRGEDRRLGGILLERGHIDQKALVAAILEVRQALDVGEEARDGAETVVPALGEMLISEGTVSEAQVQEALAVQEALREQGLYLRLGDVLVERGWVDRSLVEDRANRQERWPAEKTQPNLPRPLERVQALDPEDRKFALLAVGREMISRLQLHDACGIHAVYRDRGIEKRLYEVIEELKYLTPEDTAGLLEAVEKEVPVRPRRTGVKVRGTRIGDLALERKLVDPESLEKALDLQKALARRHFQRPIGSLLVEMGALSERDLDRLLALQQKRSGKETVVDEDSLRSRRQAWVGVVAIAVVLACAFAARSLYVSSPPGGLGPGIRSVETGPQPPAAEAREAFEREMARRGLVRHEERWVDPAEKRRLVEAAREDRYRSEGLVPYRGRWMRREDLAGILARETGERLGLVEVAGEWYTPEEAAALRGDRSAPPREPTGVVRTYADGGDRLSVEVAVESTPSGERIHFRGECAFPDRTMVRVLLLSRRDRLDQKIALSEQGRFQGVFDPSTRPWFPGRYALRVEVDEGESGLAADVPYEVRPAEAAEAFLEIRDEIESSLGLLRSLVARSHRAGLLPETERPAELDDLALAMVDAVAVPAADLRWLAAPCREARRRLRSLPGSPWLDPEGDLDALEEELDRVEVDLWSEVAVAAGGAEECRQLAGALAEEARSLAPDPEGPLTASSRTCWLLAEELAGRHREFEAAVADGRAPSPEFAGPWLGRLRGLYARCARLARDPQVRAVAEAAGRLAAAWAAPDATSREDLARQVSAISAAQADARSLAGVIDDERDRVRDLLQELAGHGADEPEAWQAWSDDWTARVLRALEGAAPIARAPSAAEPGAKILQAYSLLLELQEAHAAVRSGHPPAEPIADTEKRLLALLDG